MIASPCIDVCRMDPTTGWCQGCYRTLAEIAAWSSAGDLEKQRILAAVAGRRLSFTPVLESITKDRH